MAKKLDQIIVIDVEATCWEGEPPEGEESEIIEIGICPLDVTSGERLHKRSILVKPLKSTVSDYCTKLTTLRRDDVENGISFQDACEILRQEYHTRQRVWASYGDYDRRQFDKQCYVRDVPYPFGPTHWNVKNLFAIVNKLSREVGMSQALKILNIPLEGIHHRGEDDAVNIARILWEIIRPMQAGN